MTRYPSLSVHCVACDNEVELDKIIRVQGSETYYFSCGHKTIVKVINESEAIKDNQSYYIRGLKQKLRKFFRWKISRRTKRPTKELLEFDKQRRLKIHIVEEQNEIGEWELAHYEEEPFRVKRKRAL
jgi:hypothetical protein